MAAPDTVVALHPKAIERYLQIVDDLAGAIRGPQSPELAASIRELVETVTVERTEPGDR